MLLRISVLIKLFLFVCQFLNDNFAHAAAHLQGWRCRMEKPTKKGWPLGQPLLVGNVEVPWLDVQNEIAEKISNRWAKGSKDKNNNESNQYKN